jgi:hypothetical protein
MLCYNRSYVLDYIKMSYIKVKGSGLQKKWRMVTADRM